MFTKLLHKAKHQSHPPSKQNGSLTADDLDPKIAVHYGIPHTASILAFDPVQRLLAVGTLDGRIKIFGGNNLEDLFMSPKSSPYIFLEFLCNQGFLIGVSTDNVIQVWDLKNKKLAHSLQWQSNITAHSIIHGTSMMYVGDDAGSISVLKYDDVEEKILQLPYHISSTSLAEAANLSFTTFQSVVGILPQPFTSGNRVLIAYGNGVTILWDISEDQIITMRGHNSLQLKDEESSQDNVSDCDQEKEICCLCWASKSGSILAVGYTDGDILLWNISSKSKKGRVPSNDVVKLQLSSGIRRLPVIVLHWSPDVKSNADCSGFLFIYGGDERGSDEVLTVLHIDWPSGAESHCVARVDLLLSGSFVDMVLIPENGIVENSSTVAAFILTNPGQLHICDGSIFSNSQVQGMRWTAKPEKFPLVVPTIDPSMTISKICPVITNRNALKALLEKAGKHGLVPPTLSGGARWPVTGGIPGIMFSAEDVGIEKIYLAGYQDGSVCLWDASFPVLSLMSVIESENSHLKDFNMVGAISPVSALDFCSENLALAIGHDSGMVRIFVVKENTEELNIHMLTEDKLEVHAIHSSGTVHCTAVISVLNSPVQAVLFVQSGARLVVGFKCGQVLVVEMEAFSVLSNVNYTFGSNSGILSLAAEVIAVSPRTPKHSSSIDTRTLDEEVLFIVTKDAHIIITDSVTGHMICSKPVYPKKESTAVSMHIIGKTNVEAQALRDDSNSKELLSDSYLLLCCEDALRLYSLKSLVEGEKKCLNKLKLDKSCCWSATFKGQTEKAHGVVLLYRTGNLEIRSLPSLELLETTSLMSILRWGYKTTMDRTLSSCGDGQISLVNGCELVFVSLLACENGFRIPETMPILHDEVLAAAAHAAFGISFHKKKGQDAVTSGFLGGIIKGLKGARAEESEHITSSSDIGFSQQLENRFSRAPHSNSSTSVIDEEKELTIDDIKIEDPPPTFSSSSHAKHDTKDTRKEREKLLEVATSASKPRLRTTEEILTQYKFGGDATAAAAHARDKLVQRQEKLQRAQERAEELRNNAEDFESLAKELARAMEKKKFWNF